MTPYEQWQLEKYGNYYPESDINENQTDEPVYDSWNTDNTNGEHPEAICNSLEPAFPDEPLGRNN